VIEHLHSKQEALSSNPNIANLNREGYIELLTEMCFFFQKHKQRLIFPHQLLVFFLIAMHVPDIMTAVFEVDGF
jgi:hypothetical protein